MRLGEVLGMAIGDFVMGLGGTAYIEVVPRSGNANGARVKMMRPRRVRVGADLERLFADYLTHLACRAASLGLEITPGSPLLVNLDRPPVLAAMREGTVRDKVTALKKKGIGPAGWTPHWFRVMQLRVLVFWSWLYVVVGGLFSAEPAPAPDGGPR